MMSLLIDRLLQPRPATVEATYAAIEDARTEVVSFDAFDTLLVRPVLEPIDLHALSERTWRTVGGASGFAAMRIAAERRARKNLADVSSHAEEATLAEIYAAMAEISGLTPGILAVVHAAELEGESRWLRQRNQIGQLFAHAVALGRRIIVISDTYFRVEFLQTQLASAGFDGIERVFASSQTRLCKHTGRIYPTVLADLGIAADRVLHIGDNYHSDVVAARKSGMRALWLPSAVSSCFSDTTFALAWASSDPPLSPPSRLLLGLVISSSLDTPPNLHLDTAIGNDCERFGAAIVGPALLHSKLAGVQTCAIAQWAAEVEALAASSPAFKHVAHGAQQFIADAEDLLQDVAWRDADVLVVAKTLISLAARSRNPVLRNRLKQFPPIPAEALNIPPTLMQRATCGVLRRYKSRRQFLRWVTGSPLT